MLKILIISAVFPPEPVVSAGLSRDIAEELSKENEVFVLCPHPTRPLNFIFQNGFEPRNYQVIHLDSYTCPKSNIFGRFLESYSFGTHCLRYIKKNWKHIDCVYVNSWPLFSQYLIVKTVKKFNIPCAIHVQDIYPESLINKLPIGKSLFQNILLLIDKYSLNNSKAIICISENMRQTLVATRRIFPAKVTVVPNWQNEEDFIQFNNSKIKEEKNLPKPFTFMYLGNNGPLAGVGYLIESFVKADIYNSRLIIAGAGTRTNACRELANSLHAENIEFIPVQEGMVPIIQDKSDVMLLPVKKFGAMSSIPSKLCAYMFSSKAIIGSLDLESDSTRVILESDCGIVVQPENEDELINAMKVAAQWSKQILEEKGKNGFNYAMANFSKKQNLPKIVSVIKNIM